jgi:hypothetical protein
VARLLDIAIRLDSGQARRVAKFLLARHDADENGGWGPYDLSNLDTSIYEDIPSVLAFARAGKYPGDLGFEREIEEVWRLWRADRSNVERPL